MGMYPPLALSIYQLYEGQLNVPAFERWVYAHAEQLEQALPSDLFLILISFKYQNNRHAHHELFSVLEPYVDWGAYQCWRLEQLLRHIVVLDGELLDALAEMYRLYCRGCHFLQELGMDYGLCVLAGYDVDMRNLPTAERVEACTVLVERHGQKMIAAARRVSEWLAQKQIVFVGARMDKHDKYLYIDYR